MKTCPDHQETLWLDVYGELDPGLRSQWEKHLEDCSACREERDCLLGLLQRVKENAPHPALAPDQAQVMSRAIQRRLKDRGRKVWWPEPFAIFTGRAVPALVTSLILAAGLGWFSLKMWPGSGVSLFGPSYHRQQVAVRDQDVIQNLDLLQDMDDLQKLVKVVDRQDIKM